MHLIFCTKILKDAGYECGLSGKFHLSSAMANRPERRPKDDGMFEKNLQSDALPAHNRLQGKSLVPILTGAKPAGFHKSFVRSELYNDGNTVRSDFFQKEPNKIAYGTMYRTEKYKLVIYHGHEKGELFDLQNDPNEFRNLWDVPAFQQVKTDLLRKSFDASVYSIDTGPDVMGRY